MLDAAYPNAVVYCARGTKTQTAYGVNAAFDALNIHLSATARTSTNWAPY